MKKKQIAPKLETFKDFLTARGAQVLEPTNEWELVRFICGSGTSIIYCKKNGDTTFVGQSESAWNAFMTGGGGGWRAMPATKRKKSNSVTLATIRKRDGDLCFYCYEHVSEEEESEEHLVALTHNGPQHISNKFLTHKICNGKVGHLSAPEKIAIHVKAVVAKLETV